MNLDFFKQLLSFDSTSGKEREVAIWLYETLSAPSKELMEVGDGTLNLFLKWGEPKLVFCTHMDTVPPYIPPTFTEDAVLGRGSCDAKGQILALYSACKELEARGKDGFGLLLLAGEETGSWGAKAFAKTPFRAPYLVVGEPTENKMVSAAKGTQSYQLRFSGKAFHSGYPEHGASAVDAFVEFYNKLKATDFGPDPELGETTWNIGKLCSDNPQNILSPELTCRLYFRTTFVSDEAVVKYMEGVAEGQKGIVTAGLRGRISVTARGGDAPQRYVVPEGFESAPVAFGSDAPHLSNFGHKLICGPGSIRHAHRPDEQISLPELEEAVKLYVRLFKHLYSLRASV